MNLLLDIGNTRIKAATATGRSITATTAVVHAGETFTVVLEELAAFVGDALPDALWVSCVAGPGMQELILGWADELWGLEPEFVTTTAQACGVTNAYAHPENLGIDRWLAIIAAHHRGKGAACVVDAGTCLTLDVVDAKGKHLGGLIAPGVTSQRSAVWGRTQVRAKTQDEGLLPLATSTNDAVSFGTLHGPLGLIERVLGQVRAERKVERLLLTGGEADVLFPQLDGWELAPDLVLEGLAVVADS